MEYREMFEVAEGWPPHAFQERFALDGLPDVARIPMGAGKTAAVTLGWLWRARFADAEIRRATPRRLVIALPMRTLVEQTAGTVREWLQRLGLSDDVDVYVIMGGTVADEHTRRMHATQTLGIGGARTAAASAHAHRGRRRKIAPPIYRESACRRASAAWTTVATGSIVWVGGVASTTHQVS